MVVLEGKKLGGIVTERDIVNLVAAGGDPHSVKVVHGMTRRDLETIGPKMEIAEAAEHMATRNIRHLPVVDRGKVVGIVSIRDLTKMGRRRAGGWPRDAGHRHAATRHCRPRANCRSSVARARSVDHQARAIVPTINQARPAATIPVPTPPSRSSG